MKRVLVTDTTSGIEELSKKIVNPKLYTFESKSYKYSSQGEWVVNPPTPKTRDSLEFVETTVKENQTNKTLVVTQRYVGIGFITEKIEELVEG